MKTQITNGIQRVMTLNLAIPVALSLTACQADRPTAAADERPVVDQARPLVFSDEFNAGTLDREAWNVVGMDFWVNFEQQAYLDSPETIQFADGVEGADGGVLVLKPVYQPGVDTRADRNADFISGRINSRDKVSFTHGRVEARIKLPPNEGVWPAFWLLGNDTWPDTGEIDIMEYVGETDWTGVALHGPGYSGETPIVDKFFFPDGESATDWHVYAVEWTKDAILFEIDGRLTYRATRPMVENYGEWRFDTDKFLILNFALGGAYPYKTSRIEEPYKGLPQDTVDAIKAGDVAMYVDWVRVYEPLDTDKPMAE